ncbi:hypothetical protein E4A48_06825 [Xanthomonas cerealis pv. cerealis]|uniref:DUF1311 domain-containing protein n=1 Tax=Xanthomonas cerealis pv. cerealis TaxID=152263 RepID=A0A514ECD9_9XANT|nr:hypothetical protein [Xanthomonas translucens]QDI03443.1 hypothetical protein E4A48_06825 [Xanthomonas translucens pv. cerealis]
MIPLLALCLPFSPAQLRNRPEHPVGPSSNTGQLDADYRAFAMIAQAKRQVRRDAELERAVCALEVQWGVRRG